jgi:hypothetical protein
MDRRLFPAAAEVVRCARTPDAAESCRRQFECAQENEVVRREAIARHKMKSSKTEASLVIIAAQLTRLAIIRELLAGRVL